MTASARPLRVVLAGGCGRTGLPFALHVAARHNAAGGRGAVVVAVDIDAAACAKLSAGHWPFAEADFDADDDAVLAGGDAAAMLRGAVAAGHLAAEAVQPDDASPYAAADVVVFSTNTGDSFSDAHGAVFRGLFERVVAALPAAARPLLVVRSTLPPGTMHQLDALLDAARPGDARPLLVYAPERTAQGRGLAEVRELPQLVGARSDEAFAAACELLAGIAPKIVRLLPEEAEYAKLVANAWRFAEFAVANQFLEAVERVMPGSFARILEAVRLDYPRAAGFKAPGFSGGPCLLKDTRILLSSAAPDVLPISRAAVEVNHARMPALAADLLDGLAGTQGPRKVALLGATFKPDVDDTRASPAWDVAAALVQRGWEVVVHDPIYAFPGAPKPDGVAATADLAAALDGVRGIVVCCAHAGYKSAAGRKMIEAAASAGAALIDPSGTFTTSAPLEVIVPSPSGDQKANATEHLTNGAPRKLAVLVTGSAGFIGGYVVDELLAAGYKVVGLDNHSKYGDDPAGAAPARYRNPDYEFVRGDAKDVDLLERLVAKCDYVIAGAAIIGGIALFHAKAYDLLAENERIMACTFDACIRVWKAQASERKARESQAAADGTNGDAPEVGPKPLLRKIVVMSSSMVFENATQIPSPESALATSYPPSSTYGFQKLSCEYFAKGARTQYGLPYTICRPFNCVGLGERRAKGDEIIMSGNISLAMSHVVPDLIQKCLRGQDPLRILGSGRQVRCYTYGGDLARGIRLAMEAGAEALCEDFNLSTRRATTVLELAQLIWERCRPGEPFRYVSDEPFPHDVQVRIPDVGKAKKVLGFSADTSLEAMLDEMVPWVREQIELGTI